MKRIKQFSQILLITIFLSSCRTSINEEYPNLKKIYSNPDIFIIERFLDDSYCQDLIDEALEKKLELSPVAYAGWTTDFKDLVELLSKGPIAWIALFSAWLEVKDTGGSQVDLVFHSLQNYAITVITNKNAINEFFSFLINSLAFFLVFNIFISNLSGNPI